MQVMNRQSWLNPKIAINDSPIAGKGMVAREAIQAGENVLVFGGPYADSEGARDAIQQGKGVMQWDEEVWSIETESDDPVYLINHACDPNTWMQDAYTLIARRDILPGEEITADYVLWEADENYVSSWECHCGAAYCRHQVTGKDWRSPDLQQAYKNHFSPLINKRIASLTDEAQ